MIDYCLVMIVVNEAEVVYWEEMIGVTLIVYATDAVGLDLMTKF